MRLENDIALKSIDTKPIRLAYWEATAGSFSDLTKDSRWSKRTTISAIGGIIVLSVSPLRAMANMPLMKVLIVGVILFGFQLFVGSIRTLPGNFFSWKALGSLTVWGVLMIISWSIISSGSYIPLFVLGTLLVPLGIGLKFCLGEKSKSVNN